MSNNNLFYISPDEAEKDHDGDVIMTDYVKEETSSCIIDGDTTSVSTHNENDDDDDDDDDDDYDDDYDDDDYDYDY